MATSRTACVILLRLKNTRQNGGEGRAWKTECCDAGLDEVQRHGLEYVHIKRRAQDREVWRGSVDLPNRQSTQALKKLHSCGPVPLYIRSTPWTRIINTQKMKKRSERRKHCARAGCSKVRTPPARCHKLTDRTDYNTLCHS